VNATRPQRKRTTGKVKQTLGKKSGEGNVDSGLEVQLRKMETAAQDRAGGDE